MKFVTLAARLALNVHDLNNEAVAGNVSDIRVIDLVNLEGKRVEAPAVSGRMLKHSHLALMREMIDKDLCDGCAAGEPVRPGRNKDGLIDFDSTKTEEDAVKGCAICDVHGFLIAAGNISRRRNSRAMFSWLLPVLGDAETPSKQVVHTRVVNLESLTDQARKEVGQMIFQKQYASGIYGFVSALDLDRIGKIESPVPKYIFDNSSTKPQERKRIAVEAYRGMLGGKLGASLSHAIPHIDCEQVLLAVSRKGSLPFPISPIYPDYVSKTVGILPREGVSIYSFGIEAPPSPVQKVSSLDEILQTVSEKHI
jgi:CRISPR-associated protein Cst2